MPRASVLVGVLALGLVVAAALLQRDRASEDDPPAPPPTPRSAEEVLGALEQAIPRGIWPQFWPQEDDPDRKWMVRDVREALHDVAAHADVDLTDPKTQERLARKASDFFRGATPRLRREVRASLDALVARLAAAFDATKTPPFALVRTYAFFAPADAARYVPALLHYADTDEYAPKAARVLQRVQPPASPVLKDALRDGSQAVRAAVLDALTHPGGAPMWPDVVEALAVDALRRDAVDALGAMRVREPAVVEALAHCLRDDDGRIRAAAADALGAIGWVTAVPLQAIRDAFDEPRSGSISSLLELVATYGKHAASLDDVLDRFLPHENASWARRAKKARDRITGKER